MNEQRNNSALPLPEGWAMAQDSDGKFYFIDHNSKKTTWVDPRDSYSKPQSFSDCVGDELPLGWEAAYDCSIGVYYVNHITKTTQVEDPREEWRRMQECMLKDYLVTAQEHLEAKREIFSLKQERLKMAQQEFKYLNSTMANLSGSKTSVCSHSSQGSSVSGSGALRYDTDALKGEVLTARSRVHNLRQELDRMRNEMAFRERGVESLTLVEQKMSALHSPYTVSEAQAIVQELNNIDRSLTCGEREKRQLLQSLSQLKHELQRLQPAVTAAAGDPSSTAAVADLHLSTADKLNAASQTDLSGETRPIGARLAEVAQLRLQYEDSRKQVLQVQHRLSDIEERLQPEQSQSDKDRLLLIQEKEQYLRELQEGVFKQRGSTSPQEAELARLKIYRLHADIQQAMELNNKTIADRLRLHDERQCLLVQLRDSMARMVQLETRLRSTASTLSISSSGGGSLASLSSSQATSSSLSSLISFSDIYGLPQYSSVDPPPPLQQPPVGALVSASAAAGGSGGSGVDMLDLQRRVERLLLQAEDVPVSLSPRSSLSSVSPPISPSLDTASVAVAAMVAPSIAAVPPLAMSPILECVAAETLPPRAAVSAAVSNESVAGDSGVFEAGGGGGAAGGWLETAQLQVRLRYSADDALLCVTVQRARNLGALAVPPNTQVYIRVSLLPTPPAGIFACCTQPVSELERPSFGQMFPFPISPCRLVSKSLQLSVCTVQEPDDGCLGSVHISLADFDPVECSVRWYNVIALSAHPPPPVSTPAAEHCRVSSQDSEVSCSAAAAAGPVCSVGPVRLDESSDDASTVVSRASHTSPTLTDTADDSAIDSTLDSLTLLESRLSLTAAAAGLCSRSCSPLCPAAVADKQTNTECLFTPDRRSTCHLSAGRGGRRAASTAAAIKRSQTFSPSAAAVHNPYVCRLNRSDSDSAIPAFRRGASFQRGAVERRSLRRKMAAASCCGPFATSSINLHHPSPPHQQLHLYQQQRHSRPRTAARTSLDLELDLQAQQMKLLKMHEELNMLRALKSRLETVTQSPEKLAQGELMENIVRELERTTPCSAADQTPEERRVEKLLRRTSRDAHRLRRSKCAASGGPDLEEFREKMLFFMQTAAPSGPVAPPLDDMSPCSTPSGSEITEPSSNRSTLKRDQAGLPTDWDDEIEQLEEPPRPATPPPSIAVSAPSIALQPADSASPCEARPSSAQQRRFSYVVDPEYGVQV